MYLVVPSSTAQAWNGCIIHMHKLHHSHCTRCIIHMHLPALCAPCAQVPVPFVYMMEIMTGMWTLYIHTDVCPLPWPFMGCDYHCAPI